MSELPGDLLYTDDHEWLRREDDGSVTVGITDHAQAALGDTPRARESFEAVITAGGAESEPARAQITRIDAAN